MRFEVSRSIRAPIDEVFAYFDEPSSALEFSPHAERVEVVDQRPDGCRTYDVGMRADSREWTQTIEQVLREPPNRLVTRGGSWDTDRSNVGLRVITDRHLSAESDGTRVEATIEMQLDRPLRRPMQAVRNWLYRGAAQQEFEHQLALIAKRIEARRQP
jgi:uncharacterized protein YndB with AHSA1/START domain